MTATAFADLVSRDHAQLGGRLTRACTKQRDMHSRDACGRCFAGDQTLSSGLLSVAFAHHCKSSPSCQSGLLVDLRIIHRLFEVQDSIEVGFDNLKFFDAYRDATAEIVDNREPLGTGSLKDHWRGDA